MRRLWRLENRPEDKILIDLEEIARNCINLFQLPKDRSCDGLLETGKIFRVTYRMGFLLPGERLSG